MTHISRRSIARSAAWMAPAVAITTAAPAASASTAPTPFSVNLCALQLTNDGTTANTFSPAGSPDTASLTGHSAWISLASAAQQDSRITGYRLTPANPTVLVTYVVDSTITSQQVQGLTLTSTATSITPIDQPFQLNYSGTVAVPGGMQPPVGSVCDNSSTTSPNPNQYVAWVALGSTAPYPAALPAGYTLEFYSGTNLLGSYALENTTMSGTSPLSNGPALVVSDDCGIQNAYISCPVPEGGGGS